MHRLVVAPCALLFHALLALAAEPVGVVLSAGGFQIDGNPVTGTATVFEGSRIESGAASAELRLGSGVRLRLEPDSSGRVFGRRLVLSRGAGEWESGEGFRLEAGGLRLAADGGTALARVALGGGRKVQAEVASGAMRVTTAEGILVARMSRGTALEFEPQQTAGTDPPFEMTGCLERRGGGFVLSDPISGVVEEVRGDRLEQEAGNTVEVTARLLRGVKPVEGASEVIQVLRLRRVSRGCAAVSPATPTEPGAPAPSSAGASGARKAVIAGVVVGGAGAGAAIFLLQKKDKDQGTISP